MPLPVVTSKELLKRAHQHGLALSVLTDSLARFRALSASAICCDSLRPERD